MPQLAGSIRPSAAFVAMAASTQRAPGLEHVHADERGEGLARADHPALGDHGRAVAVARHEAGGIARRPADLNCRFGLHQPGPGRGAR